MKKLKKLAVSLLAALTLVSACAAPASAEGFSFDWTSDDNAGSHCKALFMLNLDTDTVVYADNPDEPLPMASMTKIMSYIVAYENIPDIENVKITVPESVAEEMEGTGSSEAGLWTGEEYTGKQLLYLMMVPSGNDAALTLAKYLDSLYESGQIKPKEAAPESGEDSSGDAGSKPASQPASSEDSSAGGPASGGEDGDGQDGGEGNDGTSGGDGTEDNGVQDSTNYPNSYFVKLMNEKAKELGCENTHFTNPHGLHNDNHYASARDMAVIAKYAMSLPSFTEITSTPAYLQAPTNLRSEERTVYTTNKMIVNNVDEDGMSYYYQSATGIKTGSHDQAGYCITASATAYGYTYLVVAMGSPSVDSSLHGEMLDARSLFRWAFDGLEKKTVAVQGDALSSVNLKYAWKKDELLLVAGENAAVMLPKSVDSTSIVVTPDVPESVQAPIRKGEQVGTATLSYAGEVIATVPLVAGESVARSDMIQIIEQGQAVLTSPWFLVIMAVILVLIIVYIILILAYRRKQKQLRRVKKFRDM